MNETEKKLYHCRDFLNAGSGAAMIEVEFSDHCWADRKTGERKATFYGSVHITDCSRSIELELSFNDLDGARAVAHKLDRLLDAIQGVRNVVARAARREFDRKV